MRLSRLHLLVLYLCFISQPLIAAERLIWDESKRARNCTIILSHMHPTHSAVMNEFNVGTQIYGTYSRHDAGGRHNYYGVKSRMIEIKKDANGVFTTHEVYLKEDVLPRELEDNAIEKAYEVYKDKALQADAVAIDQEVEKDLPKEPVSFISIRDSHGNIIGHMRIFNGSYIYEGMNLEYPRTAQLPVSRMLQLKHIDAPIWTRVYENLINGITPWVKEKWKRLWEKNKEERNPLLNRKLQPSNFHEVGKFFNFAEPTSEEHNAIRATLYSWLVSETYNSENEIYIAHAPSIAHARLYMKDAGMQILETLTVEHNGKTHKEYILWADGATMRTSLLKTISHLKVPKESDAPPP